MIRFILLLFLGSIWLSAAEPHSKNPSAPIENLTLHQALIIALQRHPELSEIVARIDASEARLQQAGAFPNPEAVGRIESAPLDRHTTSRAEYVAGISQPIPLGGRLSAAEKVEELASLQLSREREALALEVTRRVHNAFATALFASDLAQNQSNLLEDSEQLISLVQSRVDAGDVSSTELLRAQAEAARYQLDFRLATAARQKALLALQHAVGLSLPVRSLEGDLEEALELPKLRQLAALGTSPRLAAAEATLETERARLDLARARRIPDLNLDLLYRRLQDSRENAFDAGVRIQIPLFDRNRGRIREATAEIRAAEARLDRTRLEFHRALDEQQIELKSRSETAELLRQEVVPRLTEATRVAQLAYEAGDTSLSELLLARRESTLARLQYLEALRDLYKSWATLHSLTGPSENPLP